MASGKQGILGALSGRVANVVCSSWKGIAVFKSLPASVANPRTTAQLAQRSKMKNVVAFATKINTSVIKPLWDRFQTQKSGFNAFVQTNISLFETEVPSTPGNLVLSRGKMEAPEISNIAIVGNGLSVQVDFHTTLEDSYQQITDEAFLVIQNMETFEVAFSAQQATRANGQVTAHFKESVETGDTVLGWLAFRRADGTIVSNSNQFAKTM